MRERGLEQDIGADDIGVDEIGGPVDRAVDMAFRRKMHDRVGIEAAQQIGDRAAVADIGAAETITRTVLDAGERGEIAGIGQFVDDEHLVLGVADEMPHQGRPDETCSAGDHDLHQTALPGPEQRRKRSAVIGERTVEFFQQGKPPILVGERDGARLDRPGDMRYPGRPSEFRLRAPARNNPDTL